ncbi:hypothetical protein Micbo1qcDRAFT_213812 [Microdochium bolleyi]|uniref:Uncharacterized protein n=1 Tax=Microdochium bolleyi TaxID=196109 RepID=A0A136IUY7_9PEZI|nr:hypothetical protein Micbo1qcDRAFT_213812 [Microdochium bolleyi]
MYITRTPALAALALLASQVASQGYFVDPPVATGSVPIPGFRLDRPYPGAWDDEANSRSWSLKVNASGEGGFASLSIMLAPPPLGSPEGVLFGRNATSNKTTNWIVPENVTDTWRVIVIRFDMNETRTVADPNDHENGTCPPSVLSDACKRALRDRVRADPTTVYNVGVPGTGYMPLLPSVKDNCTGYGNATQRVLPMSTKFYTVAQLLHSFGNPMWGLNTYDRYGSRTFPFMIIWAREVNRNVTGSIAYPEIPDDHITFACVKADTLFQGNGSLPNGTQFLYDEGKGGEVGVGNAAGGSAGSMLTSTLVWAAGIVATVAMMA